MLGARRKMAAPPLAAHLATLTAGQPRHEGSAACKPLAGVSYSSDANAYMLRCVSDEMGKLR